MISNQQARAKKRAARSLMYLFLCAYAVVCLYPLVFALLSSFKDDLAIYTAPFSLPKSIGLESYARAWNQANMSVYMRNSLVYSVVTVAILAVVGCLAAYIFAKFKFKFSQALLLFVVAGMMIPIHSTIIPLAFDLGKFGLKNNTLIVILLYVAFQIPQTVFILVGFIKGIPRELEEAAVMDGCSALRVFIQIIFPLSSAALITVSILNFLAAWNNLMIPLVFISDTNLKPLSIGMLTFFAERSSDYSGVMAASVMAVAIPFTVYVLLQEKVEKGMMAGAVKG